MITTEILGVVADGLAIDSCTESEDQVVFLPVTSRCYGDVSNVEAVYVRVNQACEGAS